MTSETVRIHCFGHFRIEWPDRPHNFETAQRKPLALLKLLVALGGERVPEERLIDALWPDADGDAAHTSFNTTLYRLRRLLGQDALNLRNRQLSLDPSQVWCDALVFGSLLTSDGGGVQARALRAAQLLELYRGPFLDGESEPPEIIQARERLHGRFLSAVQDAGGALESAGQLDEAAQLLARALEVDPVAEGLCQRLMHVLAKAGKTSDALAAYRRVTRTLQAQGRRSPDAATEAARTEVERLASAGLDLQGSARSEAAHANAFGSAAPGPATADLAPRPHENAIPRRRSRSKQAAAWGIGAMALLLAGAAALNQWQAGDAGSALLAPVQDLSVPEEPSIVVLPFTTLPDAAAQHHFADGLTDTLINDLSQLHKILVIARHSAFTYKGKTIDVRQVGRELGVRHVLEGSVQISGDRVRVAVQLSEAATGRQVWAERYDRELRDIFAVQDEIANRVVEELDVKLVTGEQARAWRRMTKSLAAYSEVLAGRAIQMRDHSIDGLLRQRTYFRRAIELDPNFALAWAYMVSVHQHLVDNGYTGEPDVTYELTLRYAERAVELNPRLPIARAYRGSILQQLHRHQEALREFRLAIEYGPNDAESLMLSAWGMAAVGDAAEALPHALRAMRLDPMRPGWYWGGLGDVYLGLQRWEDAIPVFQRCVVEVRELIWCRAGLTVAYARAGRIDDARRSAQAWRSIDPKASATNNFYVIAWRDPRFRDTLTRSLRESGM